mmetsp:Transcript_6961/g.17211  ORF Transcript_6961/g.17211 Transcript_6961/m.17211 type:complete len:200 (-) Transcript_6961:2177-2776(-)
MTQTSLPATPRGFCGAMARHTFPRHRRTQGSDTLPLPCPLLHHLQRSDNGAPWDAAEDGDGRLGTAAAVPRGSALHSRKQSRVTPPSKDDVGGTAIDSMGHRTADSAADSNLPRRSVARWDESLDAARCRASSGEEVSWASPSLSEDRCDPDNYCRIPGRGLAAAWGGRQPCPCRRQRGLPWRSSPQPPRPRPALSSPA